VKEGGVSSGGGHSPMDIFDMFFGGGGGGRRRRERKGKDVVHQLSVTLDEMYNGSVRKLALQKNVVCSACEGKQVGNEYRFHVTKICKILQDMVGRKEL